MRKNLGMLPPGDIRNCLVALANTEPLLQRLFEYRFTTGDGLAGHSLGNLFLAALTEEFGFEEAVVAASRVLAISGEVLPVTLDKLVLKAKMADGRVVRGKQDPQAGGKIQRLALEPETSTVYPAARKAILAAQLVVVGPGSFLPALLPIYWSGWWMPCGRLPHIKSISVMYDTKERPTVLAADTAGNL